MRGLRARDTWAAAVVVGLSFTPWVQDKGTILAWDTPQRSFSLVAALLVIGQGLPLALRGRFPVACLALISPAFALYQFLGYRPTFASIGLYIALFTVGLNQRRHRWITVTGWSAGYATLSPLAVGPPLLFDPPNTMSEVARAGQLSGSDRPAPRGSAPPAAGSA